MVPVVKKMLIGIAGLISMKFGVNHFVFYLNHEGHLPRFGGDSSFGEHKEHEGARS